MIDETAVLTQHAMLCELVMSCRSDTFVMRYFEKSLNEYDFYNKPVLSAGIQISCTFLDLEYVFV